MYILPWETDIASKEVFITLHYITMQQKTDTSSTETFLPNAFPIAIVSMTPSRGTMTTPIPIFWKQNLKTKILQTKQAPSFVAETKPTMVWGEGLEFPYMRELSIALKLCVHP